MSAAWGAADTDNLDTHNLAQDGGNSSADWRYSRLVLSHQNILNCATLEVFCAHSFQAYFIAEIFFHIFSTLYSYRKKFT